MIWAMPSTPFNGVRISWLMVARNSVLARLAVSAAKASAWASVFRRRFSISSRCSSAFSVSLARRARTSRPTTPRIRVDMPTAEKAPARPTKMNWSIISFEAWRIIQVRLAMAAATLISATRRLGAEVAKTRAISTK